MAGGLTRHISSETPRIMVVDGSRVVRRMLERMLTAELPGVNVCGCDTGAQAKQALEEGVVDFVTTALVLPDMDGIELAHHIRESSQAYIPIVVVSGDVDERLRNRTLGDEVTDYFDKSMGLEALATFIRGYVRPDDQISGEVLYVEDSRVVALATRRMLEKHGLNVTHVTSVEDALAVLDTDQASRNQGGMGVDLVLSDVNLKGDLGGGDLLERIRTQYGYSKGILPVLIMTGDDNPENQARLIGAGANDLVQKPIEERLLITKLLFQLRVGRRRRETAAGQS